MKIALISPRSPFLATEGPLAEFWRTSNFMEAYRQNWGGIGTGLLIVAALTPSTHEITLVDENIDTLDFDAGYDLAGITCMTPQANRAYEIAEVFRKRGTPVVLGGIHPTLMPEEAALHANAVVVGEAEDQWQQVLSDAERGALRTVYKAGSSTDMSRSPVPAYDLLRGKPYPIVWIQTSRGCPRDCEFCAASRIFGGKYRQKGVMQIAREIVDIQKWLGNTRIGFADDNFLVNEKRSYGVLKALHGLGIRYVAESDISVAEKPQLLKLLPTSGCIHLFIGFESLDPNNLKNIDATGWKAKKRSKYMEYVKSIQEHGIGVFGSFIVGLDHDTPKTFDHIITFSEQARLAGIQVTVATPYPGTRLRERLGRAERIASSDWKEYTGWTMTIRHPSLTSSDIERGIMAVYRTIYGKKYAEDYLNYMKSVLKNRLTENGLLKSVP